MKLKRRHKYVLIALAVYWPLVFTLTHIPVPDIARESGMRSTHMHTMAYFVLTLLLWWAVSPYQRVRWKQRKVWQVMAIIAVYGALDEYLQGFVGRTPAVRDFIANLIGMGGAMVLLSVFRFWSALLAASLIAVFAISNLSNLPLLYPEYHLNTLFHFSAYAALTLIWVQYTQRHLPGLFRRGPAVWLPAAVSVPLLMLAGVLATRPLFDKTIWWTDAATAVFGITAAALISGLTCAVTHHTNRPDKQ